MTKPELEIRDQARLPLRRILEICLDSLSYRLLRSLLTVSIITLAIAFLASIMTRGYLGRAIRDVVREQTRDATQLSRFLQRAQQPLRGASLAAYAAGLTPDSPGGRNLAAWGGLTDQQLAAFLGESRSLVDYLRFFTHLSVGRRALLIEEHEGAEIFDWLAEPGHLAQFAERLEPMKSLKIPGGYPAFAEFVEDWPTARQRLEQVAAGYAQTVSELRQVIGPAGLEVRLRQLPDDSARSALLAQLGEHGFEIDPQERAAILAGVAFQGELAWAYGQLRQSSVRTRWFKRYAEKFSPSPALRACAQSHDRIGWIAAQLPTDSGFDAARFQDIAEAHDRLQGLLATEAKLLARYGDQAELSAKTVWLIVVSFLVCVVGIANGMLMNVLERFKEIATLKCLGARHQTIAGLFIVESLIMGVIGGVIGIAAAMALVFAGCFFRYGELVLQRPPIAQLGQVSALCLGCSLLLSGIAAIYPALVAARMAPIEAMRAN